MSVSFVYGRYIVRYPRILRLKSDCLRMQQYEGGKRGIERCSSIAYLGGWSGHSMQGRLQCRSRLSMLAATGYLIGTDM
jgi:hypothetical protein